MRRPDHWLPHWLARGTLEIALLPLVACGGNGEPMGTSAPPADDDAMSTDDAGETEGSTGEIPSGPGANVCLQAMPTVAGVLRGDLAGRDSNHGGPCGDGGPDVFFALDVPVRADLFVAARSDLFEPKIGVFANDCAAPWDDAQLLCAPAVGGWISDLAAGSRVWASVGWAEDPESSAESLPFELDVEFRRVLMAGALCQPETLGRCEGGTVCRAVGELAAMPARCESVPGDRCALALGLELGVGETEFFIDRDASHTDAHRHSCGGARTVERVYRLQLAPGEAGGELSVEAPTASAVALRGPGCLPGDELACVSAPAARTAVAPLAAGGEIYLFVELPPVDADVAPKGEEAPHAVRIRLTPEA